MEIRIASESLLITELQIVANRAVWLKLRAT
jgi:hypothetical protein